MPSHCCPASIDDERLARHVGRRVAGEEHQGAVEFVFTSSAPHRHTAEPAFAGAAGEQFFRQLASKDIRVPGR